MKISLNSIKGLNQQYSTTGDVGAIGVDALADKIGSQLGALEEVEHIGKKYEGIVIAKVMQCNPHENSDHLNVCLIDDGGKVSGVERNEHGFVQVVCGAPNVREGLLVAWLPPGSTVPESVGKDPFILGSRELRGVMSNGMLASIRELSLGESHEGILEIIDTEDRIKPGDDFAEAYGLQQDVILDIENKMFTHRPDCFGLLGVSRELAGIQGMQFRSPEWYNAAALIPEVETDVLPLTVQNELPSLVPRFTAMTMRDVKVGPSPTWLVVELAKVGLRSINNIVDYTNFFMLLTGQPLHAYDYDKVAKLTEGPGAEITIRHPHTDEKITLLNGKEIAPRDEAIMIASGDHLIGVGGVMGGADTEVDDTTERIIIEVASFDMYSVRRTSMAHGLFTDAVTRFNKGQSPLQNRAIMAKIVDELRTVVGAKVASDFIDVSQVVGREWVHPPVPVAVDFINHRLGFNLSADDMKQLLENVEFQVTIDGNSLSVVAPFWRTDIETREDVVEEVGRLYGFDKLPLELPVRSITPGAQNELFSLKSHVRDVLSRAGANEVLNYSFVHGDLLKKVGQDSEQAFQVSNALSPDLQYYRLSITPSLLDKIHGNVKAGYDEFALFEIGKAHGRSAFDENGLPHEFERVALVFAADNKAAMRKYVGAPYYEARLYLEQLFTGRTLSYVPLNEAQLTGDAVLQQMTAPFNPDRSALLYAGDEALGVVGEYKRSITKQLKLPEYCAGFEVLLLSVEQPATTYESLPRFPKISQDMTLKVPSTVLTAHVTGLLEEGLTTRTHEQRYFLRLLLSDIYQGDDKTTKNLTYRITIANYDRTLTDAEVTTLLGDLAVDANQKLGAQLV